MTVVLSFPVSRRSLERRFAHWLGRSSKAEILRVRFERVAALLADTDLPLAAIAARTGFPYVEHLSAAFKKRFGVTLGQYRSSHRYRESGR
jgi:transcriptional regulator GlxA family with amidase domain